MTAVSLFVRGAAAYLLTDTAYYDSSNRITAFASKVAICDSLRLAFACSGCAEPARIIAAIAQTGRRGFSQDEFLELLPNAVAAVREENRLGNPAGENGRCNEIKVFIALHSEIRRRAEGWACGSDASYFGPSYRPFTLIELSEARSPAAGGDFIDPTVDASAIIQAQRRHWCEEEGAHLVGGNGELTSVGAYGVRVQRVASWHDRIGHRINMDVRHV